MDLVGKYILADDSGRGGNDFEGDRGQETNGAALLDTYYGALMERLVRTLHVLGSTQPGPSELCIVSNEAEDA